MELYFGKIPSYLRVKKPQQSKWKCKQWTRMLVESLFIIFTYNKQNKPSNCRFKKKVGTLTWSSLCLQMSENQIDGLVQERHNSSALAMELRLSLTTPSKCGNRPSAVTCTLLFTVADILDEQKNISVAKRHLNHSVIKADGRNLGDAWAGTSMWSGDGGKYNKLWLINVIQQRTSAILIHKP